MSALDESVTKLHADVAAMKNRDESEMALVQGICVRLAEAIDASLAAGATRLELQPITNLHAAIVARTAGLVAAVASGIEPLPPTTPLPTL